MLSLYDDSSGLLPDVEDARESLFDILLLLEPEPLFIGLDWS